MRASARSTVSGQLPAWRYYQANATHLAPGDGELTYDISNALITVQKTEGMFQFYVQAGLYSFPTVGNPYDKANDQNSFLGPVPVAYAKLQLTRRILGLSRQAADAGRRRTGVHAPEHQHRARPVVVAGAGVEPRRAGELCQRSALDRRVVE